MPNYLLAPDVYLATTEDGAVFLDVTHDKYAGLSAEQVGLLRSVIEGCDMQESTAIALADHLVDEQLLTTDRIRGREPMQPVLPVPESVLVDMYAPEAVRLRSGHVFSLVSACAAATIELRLRSLKHAVHRVRTRKAREQPRESLDVATAEQLVTIFHRLRPFMYVASDRCIYDSLVLVEFLARYNLFPSWVFGVKTTPFHAHSWVQYGRHVLNDFPEHVRGYVPILTV